MLASGSKGNCIYIGNDTDSVVVDAGVGYIARLITENRLPLPNLRALLLTHEHSDHIRSAKALLKSQKIPVGGSGGTLKRAELAGVIPQSSSKILMHENQKIELNSLSIHSFRSYHDAAEPTGFIIDDGDARIGICLDTHKVSETMFSQLKSCDAVIIESNYSEKAMKTDAFDPCEKCLHCGAECGGHCPVRFIYPRYLKDRIIQDGHLSNEASASVISELKETVGVFALAHLSENYNRPNIARNKAEDALRESHATLYVSDQFPMYREKRMVKFTI